MTITELRKDMAKINRELKMLRKKYREHQTAGLAAHMKGVAAQGKVLVQELELKKRMLLAKEIARGKYRKEMQEIEAERKRQEEDDKRSNMPFRHD